MKTIKDIFPDVDLKPFVHTSITDQMSHTRSHVSIFLCTFYVDMCSVVLWMCVSENQ